MLFATWFITCLGYLSLTGYLFQCYKRSKPLAPGLATCLAIIVIIAQSYLLHRWIDVIDLQNLSVINMANAVVWLSLVLITLVNLWQPVFSLLLVIAPMGFIFTLLGWFDDGLLLVNTAANPVLFWHVVLAIFTIASVVAASLQALFMYVHHLILKGKKHIRWLSFFPPLEVQAKLLLAFIILSLLLLTLMLINGGLLIWFDPPTLDYLKPKLILTTLAWLLFGFLLFMGWFRPWQSLRLVPGTLLGLVIVLLAYAGWWTLSHA